MDAKRWPSLSQHSQQDENGVEVDGDGVGRSGRLLSRRRWPSQSSGDTYRAQRQLAFRPTSFVRNQPTEHDDARHSSATSQTGTRGRFLSLPFLLFTGRPCPTIDVLPIYSVAFNMFCFHQRRLCLNAIHASLPLRRKFYSKTKMQSAMMDLPLGNYFIFSPVA